MCSEAVRELEKNKQEKIELLKNTDNCDKYDYLTAAACGVIGGIIDIFLVGTPGDSGIGKWTDDQMDHAVKGFAKAVGWSPRADQKDSVASAIGFLEQKFKVNYDQRHTADVGNLFRMNTRNHHIISLSHSPDIVGLFFSILNQFTSTSSFIANGQLITISTGEFELQGCNLIARIFCGIANWFGHIMSDIAGSSGSRGNAGRGAGIAIPFYELFQFCKFGRFSAGKAKQDLSEIAIRAFQEGYDFRFGLTMAIPIMVTDLTIRLIWAVRRHFQYQKPLNECIPTMVYVDLRVMLLIGNGTLCVMDGADAAIRSGGDFLLLFTRLNLIAWFRFIILVLREISIRLEIRDALQKQLKAFIRVNDAIVLYLNELEKIDIEAYRKETEDYQKYCDMIKAVRTENELHAELKAAFEMFGIRKAWEGDFDKYMGDKSNHLVFE